MIVVSLEKVRDADASAVGPKAFALARMLRAGFPVPRGFCITASAYRGHLAGGGLRERMRSALTALEADRSKVATSVLEEVRRWIIECAIDGATRAEIERAWLGLGVSAAVRSSATAEDLPGLSFAGQYDSYLGVLDLEDCLARVKDCWASLWSDRAYEYRRANGLDSLEADMAVLVQALVPADVAGVMFTADPTTGRRDCAIIEAGFGLGPAVVCGRVTPDRLVVSKRVFRVERRVTARKTLEVVPATTGGVRERALAEDRAARPCLDDATAGRLALLGAEVEALFGGPQDVEWAVSAGEIQLLQARPITALRPEAQRSWEDRQVWTNANLREAVPDVVTPMTWSGIRSLAGPLLDPVFGLLGIEVDPFQLAGRVAGRVYFNVNTLAAIAKNLRIRSKLDAAAIFGDGGQDARALVTLRIPDGDLPTLRFRMHRLLLALPGLLVGFLRNPLRRGPEILKRFQDRIDEEVGAPWQGESDGDLVRRIVASERIPKEELLLEGRVPLVALSGMVSYILLASLCRRWFDPADPGLAHRLLVGLGGMDDADAGIALWSLAALARQESEVEDAIREESTFAGVERRLSGSAAAGAFLSAWSSFVRTHGHHAVGEFELANPRWAERPEVILGLVRSHLAGMGRVDPVARARRLAEDRRKLETECLRKLWDPFRRRIFASVLGRAQEGLRFRETVKSQTIRYFALVRRMVLELGARWVRRGIVDRAEDVFFLELAELDRVVSGSFDPRPAIAARLAEYDRDRALTPPAIVFGRFDPAESAPEVIDARTGDLRGIAVSPGVATGNARVLLHPDHGHVLPGEVLVAPSTDPSWAPCFLNAAAIVMDQGGLLSHGSIVAREYGIPCVVNVGPATKIIPTGQPIEVDGDRGGVRILKDAESDGP
jgi:phosphohistidine swiveling domain-containing protein